MKIHTISLSFHPHRATDRLRKVKNEAGVLQGAERALGIFGCGCAAETLEPLFYRHQTWFSWIGHFWYCKYPHFQIKIPRPRLNSLDASIGKNETYELKRSVWLNWIWVIRDMLFTCKSRQSHLHVRPPLVSDHLPWVTTYPKQNTHSFPKRTFLVSQNLFARSV